ncbi:hypothetical protein AXG93_496s1290 [Marchantia polymorpha subsp. ruderalis]|uniref:Uncharacterized protein n=1 Tax=Marchantia polymorpha subsp. ruderalis TaxID=1480154 RepID=A0A176VR31_MARPO|nr:hypothetical protein AXG93_496s1290 [Marchantia polymorpha subsp. ruderalis]
MHGNGKGQYGWWSSYGLGLRLDLPNPQAINEPRSLITAPDAGVLGESSCLHCSIPHPDPGSNVVLVRTRQVRPRAVEDYFLASSSSRGLCLGHGSEMVGATVVRGGRGRGGRLGMEVEAAAAAAVGICEAYRGTDRGLGKLKDWRSHVKGCCSSALLAWEGRRVVEERIFWG